MQVPGFKMRKFKIVLIVFFVACKFNNSEEKLKKNIVTRDTAFGHNFTTNYNNISNERGPVLCVQNFLKWYKSNLIALSKLEIIAGGPGISKDKGSRNYFINYTDAHIYLSKLKESGFLSEKYLSQKKQCFIESDIDFKENPKDLGPPKSFDYDHSFFILNEFEKDLDEIDKMAFLILEQSKNSAVVKIHFEHCQMNYNYKLIKENEIWLIDNIKNISNPYRMRLTWDLHYGVKSIKLFGEI